MVDHRTYGHSELHRLLYAEAGDGEETPSEQQALFCPYYVTLSDRLGADWGVIVNPQSSRFTMLTFEHDDCGCPVDHRGQPQHGGGDQRPDGWLTGRRVRICTGEDPCGQEWSDMTDAERAESAAFWERQDRLTAEGMAQPTGWHDDVSHLPGIVDGG